VDPLTSEDPSRVGRYRVHARLGAGGMGTVYLAFTPGGRPVAVKMIRPELADNADFRNRFRQEVEIARRVHGLYTAQVLDADPEASPPWLVTAFVPGPSLQDVVSTHGPLPADTVLVLMAGVAEALQLIHGAGVVHRDLKPSNVVLAPDGPRVIDFGIARAVDSSPVTGAGIRIGSPDYMAPEQVAESPAGPAADVFALGSVAAYAALGRPPFGVGGPLPVMYRVLHQPADLSGCPSPLRGIIERCLAKRAADRPSPAEVIDWCRAATAGRTGQIAQPWLSPAAGIPAAVSTAQQHLASGTIPAQPTGRLPHRRNWRRARLAAVILGLLVLPAAALTWLADRDSPAGHPAPGRTPAASGAASWLAGTWIGSADQPTGVVTHWTAELTFSRSGRDGTFRFPSLGCSGALIVTRRTPTTASVYEDLTRNPRKVCAPAGQLTLSRSGATGMRMRWQDATNRSNVATGYLQPG
jgi:Protein kinase domain